MPQYKHLVIAGSITGAASLILLVCLATHAFTGNPELTARLFVLGIFDVLLGTVGVNLITSGFARKQTEQFGNDRWWGGYSRATKDHVGGGDVIQFPSAPSQSRRSS